jgi:hypothetical protein
VFDKLTATEITEFITIVLLAYHMREADRLQTIIEEAGTKNRWHEFWPRFQKASENNEHALTQFTQFIMAQLDGGDCELPNDQCFTDTH